MWGAEVAIKVWHIRLDSGKVELRNEIWVHKSVAANYGHVLGKTIPQVLAICEDADEECMLITEFVGFAVRHNNARDKDGLVMWHADDVVLTKEDLAGIVASAGKALTEIRACGLGCPQRFGLS